MTELRRSDDKAISRIPKATEKQYKVRDTKLVGFFLLPRL